MDIKKANVNLLLGKVKVYLDAQPEEKKILTLDEIEEKHIRRVIEQIGRNKGEICEALGISRPTLERKLEKYGIAFE